MQVLMIARLNAEPTAAVLKLVKAEAQAVWQLYAVDKVRSFHHLADMSGAVLMLEVKSLDEAENIMTQFPMVQAGVLNIELLPLKPYMGLGALLGDRQ